MSDLGNGDTRGGDSGGSGSPPGAAAPRPVFGVLEVGWETGTEDMLWAVVSDPPPDGHGPPRRLGYLHVVGDGDHFMVYDPGGAVLSSGMVRYPTATAWRPGLGGRRNGD